jgi:hypothetical protein
LPGDRLLRSGDHLWEGRFVTVFRDLSVTKIPPAVTDASLPCRRVQASVSCGMTLIVAERARVPIIGLR